MMRADVIVVGAGPGGASAAYHLAKRGRSVLLLDRARFPRDKSCGDGLTRFTTHQLDEMGVLDLLPDAPTSHGARVYMRGKGFRDYRYPDDPNPRRQGRVVPRELLDAAIVQRARYAGAEVYEEALGAQLLRDDDGAVNGVVVQHNGVTEELRARAVIAADGASSRLARQAGLITTAPGDIGYAIRGYYTDIAGLDDVLEIYMPLLDPTDRYLLPSYGWVFPIAPGQANIGVGLVRRERDANVRDLFERFLAELRRDARFASMEPEGEWRGAPLRFDFRPDRCSAPGLLLVGDAAGMISPFTGEGIGYALTSGRLAAECIDASLRTAGFATPDLSQYSAALARRFTGYFEAGRESTLRHKLIWHVLENTFQNEKPLFNICRRAALFPEGIGESYVQEAFEDVTSALAGNANATDAAVPDALAPVRADLIGVGELLIATLRENWPFLTRVLTVDETVVGMPFRPALLLLICGRLSSESGLVRRDVLVLTAAAVEMGFVAALAHSSVGEDSVRGEDTLGSSAHWGNRFAVMVGDFLLSHAYAGSTAVAPGIGREIASAVAVASEGHLRGLRHAYSADLSTREYLEIVAQKAGTLFELPCRLGGLLADASPRAVSALARYGRHLGIAYQLTHDLEALNGRSSELGRAIGSDRAAGLYDFATVYALQNGVRNEMRSALVALRDGEQGADERVARLVRQSGGIPVAMENAKRSVSEAKGALQGVPDGAVKDGLLRLADFVGKRSLGQGV
ncbi:MAG: geranylgeranyl reductase family protein [Phycisphaerae bacterium]|nr:geranylgeranyl reductase family protein [Gemmatimonadaceae bacterium]